MKNITIDIDSIPDGDNEILAYIKERIKAERSSCLNNICKPAMYHRHSRASSERGYSRMYHRHSRIAGR